jgi:hypothetical protein
MNMELLSIDKTGVTVRFDLPPGVTLNEDGTFDLLDCLMAEAQVPRTEYDFSNVPPILCEGYQQRTTSLQDEVGLLLAERGYSVWAVRGKVRALKDGLTKPESFKRFVPTPNVEVIKIWSDGKLIYKRPISDGEGRG